MAIWWYDTKERGKKMKKILIILAVLWVLVGCSGNQSVECTLETGTSDNKITLTFDKEDKLTAITAKDTMLLSDINLGENLTMEEYQKQVNEYYDYFKDQENIDIKLTFDETHQIREVTKKYKEGEENVIISWSLSGIPNEDGFSKTDLISKVEGLGYTCNQ